VCRLPALCLQEDCYNYIDHPEGLAPILPRCKEAITRYSIHMNRYTGGRIRAKIEYDFIIEWQDEQTRAPLPRVEGSPPKGVEARTVVISLYPESSFMARKKSVLDMVPVYKSSIDRKNSESDFVVDAKASSVSPVRMQAAPTPGREGNQHATASEHAARE